MRARRPLASTAKRSSIAGPETSFGESLEKFDQRAADLSVDCPKVVENYP
jgi:hypothetical protein